MGNQIGNRRTLATLDNPTHIRGWQSYLTLVTARPKSPSAEEICGFPVEETGLA